MNDPLRPHDPPADSGRNGEEVGEKRRPGTRSDPAEPAGRTLVTASYVVEAPGDVAIEYRPAGLGSRFLAALLDHLVLGSVLIFLAMFLHSFMGSMVPVAAAWILLYIAYFSILEGRTGRTLGKVSLGLRVLSASGLPPSPRAALIRNILRLVDFLPQGLPGALLMCVERHGRRLGDLLAGTVVVRESGSRLSRELLLRLPFRERPHHPLETLRRVALSPAEYQALRIFCFRTRTLPREQRLRLARLLLAPLHERAGLDLPPPGGEEDLLVDLLHFENGTFGRAAPGVTAREATPLAT